MDVLEQATQSAAVTLDLWLTLIAERDGSNRSQQRIETRANLTNDVLSRFGLTVDQQSLREASRNISEMVTSDHDLGIDLEFKDRIAQMLSLVDSDITVRLGDGGLTDVADAVDQAFLGHPPSFLPGAIDVLQHLETLDIKVALISNTGLTSPTAYREWFDAEGALGYFDHLTFSNEVACAKPNPGIFCPTLEKVGSVPESALHIGDNLLTDISGAANVGMKTGWISGFDTREPIVNPDYTLASITELPTVVEHWMQSGSAITA